MSMNYLFVPGLVGLLCPMAHAQQSDKATAPASQESTSSCERLRKDASALLAQGKAGDAVDRLKEALAANPKCDQCWLDLEDALERLHGGKVPLEARDAMIAAYPSSAMPHVFKAVALFKDERFSESDAEFANAEKLESHNPYVYGYRFQIETLNGQYDKALADHTRYSELGGAKIFGSSAISGKGVANLEEEVVLVTIAVGHSLDHFDLVVHALKQAGMQGVLAVGQDAVDPVA